LSRIDAEAPANCSIVLVRLQQSYDRLVSSSILLYTYTLQKSAVFVFPIYLTEPYFYYNQRLQTFIIFTSPASGSEVL